MVFMFGTFWVRARGLEIDCGCFGGGGPVIQADSLAHLWEQVLFASLGAWLLIFPKSTLSVDVWLNPTK
ncbi:MAG: hypothetical protein MUP36_02445 [Demequinaceae bacterium]|nr:hypothetical protein [Demequinaceae bacterium]